MTPAEFYAVAQAKIGQRNEEWKFQDILNGVQCSVLANINRSAGSPPHSAEEFMIMREKKPQTPEEIARIMDQRAGVNNG